MKRKTLTRITSLIITTAMVISCSGFVFADETEETDLSEETSIEDSMATSTLGVPINPTSFPDSVFRNYISTNFDTDHNTYLSASEISSVTKIVVERMGISDLTGINYFTSLEQLFCYGNQLSSLDVSRCASLKWLSCSNNQITSLNISGCVLLTNLYCHENRLSSVNISNQAFIRTAYTQGSKSTQSTYYVYTYLQSVSNMFEFSFDRTTTVITNQSQPIPDPLPIDGEVDMYRLYNPNSGEHFYTSNPAERDMLIGVGWSYEGIGWTAPATSNTPVYRLYNANGGEHHYTTNAAERDFLISIGWTDEDIGWYSDDARGVPLYRQYNPNAFANNHNYTTSLAENDFLVSLGWQAEDIGWYGVA